jgi:hypothetical protein
MSIEQSKTFRRFLVCSWHRGGISSAGGSVAGRTGGAGDAEAWEEVREAIVALGAQEEVTEGPAEEGPVQGPWGGSSAAAEVHLPLPAPLVGVTGSGGKAGGPLTAFDVEGEDILLSPPPDSNRFISSSSSLQSSFFFFSNQQFIMQGSIAVCGQQYQGYCTNTMCEK